MLLWFVGLSVVLVWLVFQSPALDVRFVAVGALLPWLDVVTGGAFVLHTLVGSVVVLAVVMLATRRRRLLRRRLLGIPIGMFLHLVLDGTWADSRAVLVAVPRWRPLRRRRCPELDRTLGVVVAMEVAGVVALVRGSGARSGSPIPTAAGRSSRRATAAA